MTTRIWTTRLDSNTAAFKSAFGNLSEAQLNWKPDPQTWSIAQNIDHLIVINKTYYPVIQSVREGTYTLPLIGKFGFMVRFMSKVLLNAVQPDRRKKMKTFPVWEPSSSTIAGDILERFGDHQEDLKHLIINSQDLLEKGTLISSPANRNIVYKLETAFEIIVIHEQRHFAQAREVLEKLNTASL
ncbi:MAG TPA: DinB family protein [Ohtaekwangia sp.]